MTGLEKILKHIEEEATKVAEKIIGEANEQAEKILAEGRAERDKINKESLDRIQAEEQSGVSRGQSAALLQKKKRILEAKQELINQVIEKAKASLFQVSDQEYFDFILKMIEKNAKPQKGKVLFSPTDQKRIPEQLEEKIRERLSSKEGASLTLSEETRNIDGGFVLIYDDIEENCSFEALFLAVRESLQDKVGELLFH